MSKLTRILKLYLRGVSKKRIARVVDISRNTVKVYVERFVYLGRKLTMKSTWKT